MINQAYFKQVDLLLQILPYIAQEKCFALKGGTAINLFVRDLPRLSVDIDLTYLPFDNRTDALKNISDSLLQVKENLEKAIPNIKINTVQQQQQETKLICQVGLTQVKIEANTVIRGNIFSARNMPVTDAVQNMFNKFASIQVVSNAELFGGKICAALDRQHPRDLFDVSYLLNTEGFSEDIKLGFIASLLSHDRPINELLKPELFDKSATFDAEFVGMTDHAFLYEDYEKTRMLLIQAIHDNLTSNDKAFLISFKEGTPAWQLNPIKNLKDMPALKWKLQNIKKLIDQNPDKHKLQLQALKETLSIS
jgi:predicted nucleotidyltransferase component of viral defense system